MSWGVSGDAYRHIQALLIDHHHHVVKPTLHGFGAVRVVTQSTKLVGLVGGLQDNFGGG